MGIYSCMDQCVHICVCHLVVHLTMCECVSPHTSLSVFVGHEHATSYPDLSLPGVVRPGDTLGHMLVSSSGCAVYLRRD
jgi:hypothetical protein